MKKIFCFLPALAFLMALSGCCANNSCNCQDELADALLFSFDIKSANGFKATDIDTLFIVRITHPTAAYPTIARDSVLRILPLTASGTDLKRDSIVINNAAPFSLSGGNTKLSAYDFQINASQVTAAGGIRTTRRFTYTITNIKLDGRYNANGCCTCYLNTQKQFDISSRFLVATTTNLQTTRPTTTAVQTAATPAQTKVIAVNTDSPIPQTPTVTQLTR